MKKEIEIKLQISPDKIDLLLNNPFISVLPKESPQRLLKNAYFDSDDWQLQKHKVALRIRNSGQDYIQTLKTRDTSA
jgi:inorganic triphosphatase YgiF